MTASKIKLQTNILPLTIVSMFLVTKWWFALPVDGPDKMYWGFPLAFMGEGFHTSMSYQFFVVEFIADFAIYFSVWLLLSFTMQKWLPNIRIHKTFFKIIWSFALVLVFGLYMSISNPVFHTKRRYDWYIMSTGYVFIWQATPSPDIMKYHPFIKKETENLNLNKQ